MKKKTNQSRTRLQSLDAAQLAKVSGGAWNRDLLIMGGCFPTEPVPEPYPLPSPYPIPVW
jgi:hypothetical protein